MRLPFTFEEFLDVFENYNQSVYPMQIVLYLLAAIAIYSSIKKRNWSDQTISGILSFFWLWMGILYHFIYFASINNTAYFFGGLFVIQGILFLWKGVYQNQLSFRLKKNTNGFIAMALLLFALIVYPAISYALGHVYPETPTFGLPCPTTIFTFGMFLLLDKKYPKIILIVPFIWAIIGFSAAFSLGIKEDISLFIGALITSTLLFLKNKHFV